MADRDGPSDSNRGLSKGRLQDAPVFKMERLMSVWDTIEKQVPLVKGGSMFEIQMKGNQLKPM